MTTTGKDRIGDLPWWAPGAIRRMEQILTPETTVLEFGSGVSSGWMAERVGFVLSIDDNAEWFHRSHQLSNRHRRLAVVHLPQYLKSGMDAINFDADGVVIDGHEDSRLVCIETLAGSKSCLNLKWLLIDDGDLLSMRGKAYPCALKLFGKPTEYPEQRPDGRQKITSIWEFPRG